MPLYADVIIDISVSRLDKIFQYRVPKELIPEAMAGRQALVPFGPGDRLMKAFIVAVGTKASYDESKIKDIISVDSRAPEVEGQLIALADWMRNRYGATMAQTLKTVLPVRRSVKEVRHTEYVLADEVRAKEMLEKIGNSKREKARVRMLGALIREKRLPKETVTGVLRISSSTLKALLNTGIVREESVQEYRDPAKHLLGGWDSHVRLNEEQARAVNGIWGLWQNARAGTDGWRESDMVHLLYGITGSGKTEVYMELIDRVISEGRQVIVLIPEISLTLQTVSRFYDRFGSRIAVMHSRLSAGERYDQFMRARRGEAQIMIGPRSALFAPFENLGMIIIDEEHENSYKSETAPRYDARETAIERAKMANAMVVMGSATPSVGTYSKAVSGIYGLHKLSRRAKEGSALPDVEVVDLREEFSSGNRGIISRSLHDAMSQCLEEGSQMMLFINRRGYAGFVSCRSCGYVMKCSHCDVSMTLHHNNRLKCHYCGCETDMPKVCPSCGSPYIAAFGLGTEKVEDFVKKEFPSARVLRMDRDTTSGKDDMEKILTTFSEGGADILIGTQMIVKGHDFDKVTLVGIIAADLSMFSGDFMSGERTFELLTQAAGRAGRGDRPGKVIIQTYQPGNYCITDAACQDYEAFYDEEIRFRKAMNYPPCVSMMQITAEGQDEDLTSEGISLVKNMTEDMGHEGLEIIGPSRAPVPKVKDMYRFVLYMKHPDEDVLTGIRQFTEDRFRNCPKYQDIYFNYDLL